MSNLAPVGNCSKGERTTKLNDIIRSIGHLLTNFFRKISLFSIALNMDPKCALNL